ncbi:tissue inhibitor of metalloproteases [Paramuricea clavata]|uniref:Tissue inhibitor of metalloproteases n=1 Tax=Paramuricea clavata TaxID=317549 RepID=A0A7D9D4W9_PARCT|nr:tissue inhibitor of metalloproteases [Paramuricea clavata]
MSGSVVCLMLFVACLCLLQQAQGSFMMIHPQKMFCDADYVFKFKAMQMVEDNNAGRTKRMVPGGNRQPKKQMVEVQRIYKGEKMMMPMMKLQRDTDTPVDSFSAATKIEAGIQLGMYQKEFKKNEKCVFFGKMFRYRNDTMMPASSQKMMANLGNTMVESSITKIMRRGLRRKYAKGCKQGCKVRTVYWNTTTKSKEFCDWNVNQFRPPQIDCRKTTQFCYRGKDGYCQWKATKDYKKCLKRNKLP